MGARRRAVAGGVGAVLVVLVVLGLWWRSSGGGPDGSRAATADEEAAALSPRARPRVDPATLEAASLGGTVRARGGDPVAGARVCVRPSSKELAGEDVRAPTCTTADAQGRYRFAPLLPARYRPVAGAPHYLAAAWEPPEGEPEYIELAPGEQRDGVDLILDPGGVELSGVVLDIGGGPVAGAAVTTFPGRVTGMAPLTAPAAFTDAEGAFSLWVAEGPHALRATAEGYAAGIAAVRAPGQRAEILLTPESVLAGTVVDAATGEPVARAQVFAGELSRVGSDGSAFTDDQGRFRITRLSPGRYKPTARIAGGFGQTPESVLLGLGETAEELVIELHPAAIVSGRVLVGDEGETPCPSGWVRLSSDLTGRGLGTEVDGRVEFEAVLPGSYEVSVYCDDHLSAEEYPPIEVTGEDVTDLVWRVTAGAAVVGTVRDAEGQPVAGANVRLTPKRGSDPRAPQPRGWTETDDDGRYEARGLAAGTADVQVHSDRHPPLPDPVPVTVPAEGEVTLDLTLPGGGAIAGRVVDDRGQPVGGVQVTAASLGRRDGFWNDRSETSDDGTFELRGVPPGKKRVYASDGSWGQTPLRAPGQAADAEPGKLVEVAAGERAEVELVVERRTARITGRVLDESGAPVTDAFVAAEREPERAGASAARTRMQLRWSWNRKPAMTDTDGAFELSDLAPGRYTVRAYRRGGGEALAEGVAAGSTVTLSIPAAGSISGQVRAGAAAPRTFRVVAADPETGFRRAESFYRTGGAWALHDLPAGTFQVTAAAEAGTATETIALAAGQERRGVVIELAGRGVIAGRVVDADTKKPVPGLMTGFVPLDGARIGWSEQPERVTDRDGRFRIEDVPAGSVRVLAYAFRASDSRYSITSRVTSVEAGETAEVTLEALASRLDDGERSGDLGFDLNEPPPAKRWDDLPLTVASVRASGPAAGSGLEAGDEIVSVDGRDVRGDRYTYLALSRVPAGTTVRLGLARGDEVAITAGPPRVGAL